MRERQFLIFWIQTFEREQQVYYQQISNPSIPPRS